MRQKVGYQVETEAGASPIDYHCPNVNPVCPVIPGIVQELKRFLGTYYSLSLGMINGSSSPEFTFILVTQDSLINCAHFSKALPCLRHLPLTEKVTRALRHNLNDTYQSKANKHHRHDPYPSPVLAHLVKVEVVADLRNGMHDKDHKAAICLPLLRWRHQLLEVHETDIVPTGLRYTTQEDQGIGEVEGGREGMQDCTKGVED